MDAVSSERIDGAFAPRTASARKLQTLLKVSSALAGSLELTSVLQTAIQSAVEVLDLDAGVIYLLRGDALYMGATVPPLPDDFPDEHRHALVKDHPHIGECLGDLHPVVVPDALLEDMTPNERLIVESRNLRSGVFAPLALEGRPLGTFIVQSIGRVCEFTSDDVDLCRTVAHQISLAVANAMLFERAERRGAALGAAYDATLLGWSRALDMRDHDTAGHTERVAERAVQLAVEMGIPASELVHVRRGALLHDIGKICVPDAVLRKPGALSEEEWAIMRTHPIKARQMLEGIEYLESAADIPYSHHERWDGSGYPQGLSADDIPLLARLFAVVDVYDALTSERPYRPAWSREAALSHIRAQAGIHFDPVVVDAFFRVLESKPW